MIKGQKYHIMYKTTCTITGNFYIGVHSTKDLDDGYLGSGKRLRYSIQKYGKDNHKREILEFFETREDLLKREKEVVNKNLLSEEKCINLKEGGEGGLHLVDAETRKRIHRAGAVAQNSKGEQFLRMRELENKNPILKQSRIDKICQTKMERTGSKNGWKGKRHRQEVIEKMKSKLKNTRIGEKNSQFGTRWINNGIEVKKIKKEDFEIFLSLGWRAGRKLDKLL